jgi:WD40 repeat protein
VAFSPNGKTVALACYQRITLWDLATGQEQASFLAHTDWVSSVAFSRDGKTLASGSFDRTIKLWDVSASQKAGN